MPQRSALAVDAMLARIPTDDPELESLRSRADRYGTDCGCAMGAVFLVSALVLALLYTFFVGDLSLSTGVGAVAFTVIAAPLGKLVGLATASLRLSLLRRSISRRFRPEKGSAHVHMY